MVMRGRALCQSIHWMRRDLENSLILSTIGGHREKTAVFNLKASSHQTLHLLMPCSWTSHAPGPWGIHFCCLSNSVYGSLVIVAWIDWDTSFTISPWPVFPTGPLLFMTNLSSSHHEACEFYSPRCISFPPVYVTNTLWSIIPGMDKINKY